MRSDDVLMSERKNSHSQATSARIVSFLPTLLVNEPPLFLSTYNVCCQEMYKYGTTAKERNGYERTCTGVVRYTGGVTAHFGSSSTE